MAAGVPVRPTLEKPPPNPLTPQPNERFEKAVYAKATRRIIPFLFLCYVFAYVDRVNIGFAKLQMQANIGISDAVYGFGAGIFFLGYFLFEIPCNLMLQRIGAKRWLGPIMIIWGVVSGCQMFITGPASLYGIRFLLGVVESGFFPGVILYLTFWYPRKYRAKMIAAFMTAVPLSGVFGGPISGWILGAMSHMEGLHGWQWLFVFEAIPSIVAGVLTTYFLDDSPQKAKWLNEDERSLLLQRLREEEELKRAETPGHSSLADAFRSPKVWALCFIYFGTVMVNYGISFWLPQIVKDTLSKNVFHIGLLTAIPWAAAAIAMVVVGHHSDKTGERRWHIAGPAIVCSIAFALSALPGVPGPCRASLAYFCHRRHCLCVLHFLGAACHYSFRYRCVRRHRLGQLRWKSGGLSQPLPGRRHTRQIAQHVLGTLDALLLRPVLRCSDAALFSSTHFSIEALTHESTLLR